jgi:type II secretory pathway pseudopilin PulG
MTPRSQAGLRRPWGYTYIGLLILLAVLALAAALTLQVSQTAARRDAERELLAIGNEFDAAFASYARQSPPGANPYPQSLQDLVRDPRMAGVKRHLRRIYPDPLTGRPDWQLFTAPGGGIVAVASAAQGHPLREYVTPFAAYSGASAPAQSYGEWRFGAVPDFDRSRLTPIYPTPAIQAVPQLVAPAAPASASGP